MRRFEAEELEVEAIPGIYVTLADVVLVEIDDDGSISDMWIGDQHLTPAHASYDLRRFASAVERAVKQQCAHRIDNIVNGIRRLAEQGVRS